MGRKFNRWLREAAKRGINVGDIHQAAAIYTGQTPAPQQPAPPPPPPAPKPIKPPTQTQATISSTGAGVGRSKRKVDKRRLADLRIKRKKKPGIAATGSPTGTGLNTPKV